MEDPLSSSLQLAEVKRITTTMVSTVNFLRKDPRDFLFNLVCKLEKYYNIKSLFCFVVKFKSLNLIPNIIKSKLFFV